MIKNEDHEMCISIVLAFSNLERKGRPKTVLEEAIGVVAREMRETTWHQLPERVRDQIERLAASLRTQTNLVNYDN